MQSKIGILIFPIILVMFFFGGCSSGGSDSSSISSSLSGVAQKGAFLKDSNVSLCKLNEKMDCTADVLEAKVSDDKGSYEFKTLPWSGLSRLTISGYYLDELTGTTSLSPATITAIVNIKSNQKQKTNTNLLTDMRAKRMKDLVEKGKSVDEASDESMDDVKKLFNVSSDDFTSLDLVDFSAGKASVNAELLRISAAVANAQDPVGTLEELMKIYKDGGIEAVLNSTLYRTLMGLIQKVKVKEVLTKMVGADEANAASITNITPFAVANIVTYGAVNADNKVRITLLGTEFTGAPSISVSSSNNLLGIDNISLSDDNMSAILDMNISTSCIDINATFTVDYMTLKDLMDPIRTNELRYKDEISICATSNVDDDVNSNPVTVDPSAVISLVPLHKNQIRLTLLGTEFENYTGSINAQLITTSSTLAIDNTAVSDNNKSVIFTLNEETNYCAENNVTIGLYTNNLKDVPNSSDTFNSNKIRYVSPDTLAECSNGNAISVPNSFNRAPTVSITPSVVGPIAVETLLELNATAVDANSEDSVTLQWRYKRVDSAKYKSGGTTSHFSQGFISTGLYIVDVNATDNHGASTLESIEFEVVAVNHAPTVRISPSGDKSINVGESVLLKSSASDEDGDELSISWKLKESAENDFTTVANYGETGFSHTFDTVGTYLVVVEAEDGNGSTADANITVNVTAVPDIVTTLDDINITLRVKEITQFSTGIANGSNDVVLQEASLHGNTSFILVGGEFWHISYESKDCFIGIDSFLYKHGNDYGRVNVTITSASSLQLLSETKTLFNTETINGEYLRAKNSDETFEVTTDTHGGSASLIVVGNEIINYNYRPDSNFTGNDFFEYSVSETINECSYSDIGRISFIVEDQPSGLHLFTWYDDVHGYEIWRTDGTVAGTVMVKDIRPGTYGGGSVDSAVVIDGIYYFGANDGVNSTELWRSDGTESGTTMVKNINAGADDGSFPYHLSVIDNNFYFFARTGDNNGSSWKGSKGLYKSDGTEVGTLLVEDFGDDSLTSYMGAGYLQSFANLLIFAQDDGAGNGPQWEPWISDGSSSSFKLKDIWPGDEGSSFIGCIELANKCYAAADDYVHGSELWVTDGTSANTHMVKDINENNDSVTRGSGGGASNLTVVGDKLFFVSFDTVQGVSLWKSDGTESGTQMLKDSFADENETNMVTRYGYRDNYSDFTAVNNTLFFKFNDGIHGQEIWKSDGTNAGTVMLKDMGSDDFSAPSELREMNGTLYFWFTDNTIPSNSGLYKTDGSSAGTVLVKAFSSDDFEVSGRGIIVDGSKLYIELLNYANNGTKEYWISDGTSSETFKLVDGESWGEGN